MSVNKDWPRLGSFPLTNGIGVLVLAAWSCTALISFGDAVLSADWALPATWWDGLKWFTGYAFAQFTAKRWTNGRGVNGNGHAEVKP